MINIVSTSTWKTCVYCGSYRRHVSLAAGIGALCAACVVQAK